MQGIKERIASETASLRTENKSLQNEINEAFIQRIYLVLLIIHFLWHYIFQEKSEMY